MAKSKKRVQITEPDPTSPQNEEGSESKFKTNSGPLKREYLPRKAKTLAKKKISAIFKVWGSFATQPGAHRIQTRSMTLKECEKEANKLKRKDSKEGRGAQALRIGKFLIYVDEKTKKNDADKRLKSKNKRSRSGSEEPSPKRAKN